MMNFNKNITINSYSLLSKPASFVKQCLLLVCVFLAVCTSVNAQDSNTSKDLIPVVKGFVRNESDSPIFGANITLTNKGKRESSGQTKKDGSFEFLNVAVGSVIRITHVGYASQEIKVKNDGKVIQVNLALNTTALNDVVVNTGLYKRKVGNFTGAAHTMSGDELKMTNPTNILQAISALDPSFRIQDNNIAGSDPNQLANIQLRGANNLPLTTQGGTASVATPVSNGDIMSSYLSNPNQPLLILDGFQITLQTLVDLDINRIASVTILKDAAATTAYGSRSANGVIVIETKQPPAGKLQITYSVSANLSVPDLSSYHLMNASQFLQAQLIAGVYTDPNGNNFNDQGLKQWYNYRLQQVESGVNTDWLAQPVQVGFGETQSLSIGGGAGKVRYSTSLSYNDNVGVMKGSDNSTYSFNTTWSYFNKGLHISNNTSFSKDRGDNSPWGSFAAYAALPPYYSPYDASGHIVQVFPGTKTSLGFSVDAPGLYPTNPMYNATLQSENYSFNLSFNNATLIDWAISKNLRVSGGFNYALNLPGSEQFLPPANTAFVNPASYNAAYLGSYTESKGQNTVTDSKFSLDYSTKIGLHSIFATVGASAQTTNSTGTTLAVLGIPNYYMGQLGLANGYGTNTKPSTSNNKSSSLSSFTSISYNYDGRYTLEVTGNVSGSSQFGANNRFAPFWAGGLGWNVDKEKFFKPNKIIQTLRIRATTGLTGNQNFGSLAQQTYAYNTTNNYRLQLGATTGGYANPDLKWQSTLKNNIGLTMGMFEGKLNVSFDGYIESTNNLILPLSVIPSTGFNSYQDNLGATRSVGYEVSIAAPIIKNTKKNIFWTVSFNAGHYNDIITRLSPAINALNAANNLNGSGTAQILPLPRFVVGQSMTQIWAVPSLGIDPATGQEVFRKLDGSTTFIWNANDKRPVGDATSKLKGSISSSLTYKSFFLDVNMGYEFGGQVYNQTLVNEIEDINLQVVNADTRVLTARWKQPGDISSFKSLAAGATITNATSRFVQNNNYLNANSVTIGYSVPQNAKWVRMLKLSAPRFSFTEANAFRFSTVEEDRGLSYPFARTVSFGLSSNF
jgi:TonB-linked SusC/RagA family outer membrane protein